MKKQKKIKKVKVQKINPKPAVKNPADIIRDFQDNTNKALNYIKCQAFVQIWDWQNKLLFLYLCNYIQ